MTNQTIDGVPRDLIEDALAIATTHATANWSAGVRDKLRALLDKEVSGDSRAPQPQGEPIYQVMYLGDGGGGWSDAEKDSYDVKVLHPKHWRTRKLYAEQPAPVAVVMPEQLIAAIEAEQERLSQEDYLMDSEDCVKVIREEVTRLNTK